MAFAKTRDGTRLYYEEVGSGTPVVFLHEFAGDYRSWEHQMRYFSRRHRCIAYSARGYLPSDIPASPDAYSFRDFMSDAIDLMDQLAIRRAHVVGLSMGGYTTLQVGLNHPDRAMSLTLAATGSGSPSGRIPARCSGDGSAVRDAWRCRGRNDLRIGTRPGSLRRQGPARLL